MNQIKVGLRSPIQNNEISGLEITNVEKEKSPMKNAKSYVFW